MGDLFDYFIVLSEVKYNDDPMKFGRIRCDIPGFIHAANFSPEALPDALPWVRPFKMSGYQTFSKPIVGQKIWVLVSKTNYNEFWWFPFHETLDFVQDYLNANYDNQPDVIHARDGSAGQAIFTYDDANGYILKLGGDYMALKLDGQMEISFNNTHIKIDGGQVYCGKNDGNDEPCILGDKFKKMRDELSKFFNQLSSVCKGDATPLKPFFKNISAELKKDINSKNVFIN